MSQESSLASIKPSHDFRTSSQRLVQRYQLGTLLRCYTYSRWFWLFLAITLLLVINVGFSVYKNMHEYTIEKNLDQQYIQSLHPGPNDPLYKSGLAFQQQDQQNIVDSIGSISGSIIALFGIFVIVRRKVYLCRDGLLYRGAFKRYLLRWEDVIELTDTGGLCLHRADGRSLTFDNAFHDFEELRLLTAGEIVSRLLPDAIAQYERGEPVIFGDVRVETHGVTNKVKSLAWDQFDAIQLTKVKWIELCSKGEWIKWDFGKQPKNQALPIPNNLVFIELVRYVLEQRK